jgi:hypothetical protein
MLPEDPQHPVATNPIASGVQGSQNEAEAIGHAKAAAVAGSVLATPQ